MISLWKWLRLLVLWSSKQSNPDDDLIGGHMIIYWTPNPQHLEGVEIRNFGQQGRLGRYPTHFHLCGNSTGSVMTKNVV